MNEAIADILQTTILNKVEITQYAEACPDWQTKITQACAHSPDQIQLIVPEDVVTLAKIVKQAYHNRWQLIPCGRGSKLGWGKFVKGEQFVLSTQKCDRVIAHEIGDLTVTVEAGIKLTDLQKQLSSTNQFLPIDPSFGGEATIGGILATADTGSLRHKYGGIRDLVLGISLVRGDGEIAKAGGRVVKNVAGYDLMKLLIGSYGTLGIITQVTLRTYPIPQDSQTLVISGDQEDLDQAIKLIKKSSLTPSVLDFINKAIANDLNLHSQPALVVRFQTITASIKTQLTQLEKILQNLEVETTQYQSKVEASLWQQITQTFEKDNKLETVICKLGVLPNKTIALSKVLNKLTSTNWLLTHLGSGIGTLKIDRANIQDLRSLRDFCNDNNGFLTILTAPPTIKQNIDVWGYRGNALSIMETIKHKFDPHGIFNKDRFIV